MSWKIIPDEHIHHIWAPDECPDGVGEISVAPSWYAENGTPVDGETGDDMSYVRTEIYDTELVPGRIVALGSPSTMAIPVINDGGPAFPRDDFTTGVPGMSLRDWFAGQASGAALEKTWLYLRNREVSDGTVYSIAAKASYEFADAMISARKGGAK